MSRGKNNANLVSAASPALQNTPASTNNSSSALRRGNKTLAWYISDKILDKNETEARDSASPLPTAIRSSQSGGGYRKGSVDSQSSVNSNKPNEALNGHNLINSSPLTLDEEKRRKRDRRARPRSSRRNERDYFSIANNTKENNCEEKEEEGQELERKTSNTPNVNSFLNKDRKEDYWYFDPVSDGFYYEFNGSRGWRKRNPKLHGPGGVPLTTNAPVVPLKGISEVTEPQKPLGPVATPNAASHQTSKFFPTATAVNVPNIKYYDPASDGFFYEMASIDGWRRRQPLNATGSNGMSPPSQGHVQQQRVFRPLQTPTLQRLSSHLLHQQQVHDQSFPLHGLNKKIGTQQPFGGSRPAPNLTNAELEDMIVQSRSSVPPLSRGPSSLLLQAAKREFNPVSFASVTQKGVPNRAKEDCHSSSSTTISSSLSDDHCSPPPPGRTTNPWANSQRLIHGKAVEIGAGTQTQVKQQPIGSFEEPYEFYWSDNEKNSMCSTNKACSVSSADEIMPPVVSHHLHHHPTLAAYFNDISLQEQYNEQLEQQMKQHEHLKQLSSMQLKRPNSLRLACTPQAVTTNHSQLLNQQQYKQDTKQQQAVTPPTNHLPFNVDQFIADLPLPDHEKILSNLSALRTPMIDSNHRFSEHYQDSPLLTPFVLKEENYGWIGGNGGKGCCNSTCANRAVNQNGATLNSFKNLERDLKDIEKIWKCPAF